MTKSEKKSFNESLAGWKLFLHHPTTREFLGRAAKSWGLFLLFCLVFLWAPGCALLVRKVGYASGSANDELPKYCDRIPSAGLTVFPKPLTALERTFSMSDPSSYDGYLKDLKTFLKPYSLEEQKSLANRADGVLFEQKGPDYVSCRFPDTLLQACSGRNDPDFGYSQEQPCILVKMKGIIGLKPEGSSKIDCISKDENSTCINLS